jgi:glycosyltransferase involved in cell wall biosynthesis
MRLDIVIPAHNEEARIGRMLGAYRRTCSEEVRLIVAMDDCRDRTSQVVAAHAQDDPRVECVAHPKLGKGGVIAETFRRTDGELVAFVDPDGATPPQELLRLAHAAGDADSSATGRLDPRVAGRGSGGGERVPRALRRSRRPRRAPRPGRRYRQRGPVLRDAAGRGDWRPGPLRSRVGLDPGAHGAARRPAVLAARRFAAGGGCRPRHRARCSSRRAGSIGRGSRARPDASRDPCAARKAR